jgi:hypothetical protein
VIFRHFKKMELGENIEKIDLIIIYLSDSFTLFNLLLFVDHVFLDNFYRTDQLLFIRTTESIFFFKRCTSTCNYHSKNTQEKENIITPTCIILMRISAGNECNVNAIYKYFIVIQILKHIYSITKIIEKNKQKN